MRLLPRRRPKIENLKQAGDIDGLRAMLDYRDTRAATDGVLWDLGAPIRAEATTALAGFEGPVAEEGLAHALADPHPVVRKAALDAIAGLPRPVAADRLLQGLVSWPFPGDYSALEQAIGILVDWAPEGLADDFATRLLDPQAPELDDRHEDGLAALLSADPSGEAAATALANKLVTEVAQQSSSPRAARAEKLLAWLGAPGTDTVVRALETERVSPALVRTAAALRNARAVEPLVNLLGAADEEVRAEAATALGRLNDTRAVQALLASTQDPEQSVRDAASEALNGMGMAAVMIVVAGVMRDAVREQLGSGEEAGGTPKEASAATNSLPPPSLTPSPDATPAHPPTWAQEVLGRLLRRSGGQP